MGTERRRSKRKPTYTPVTLISTDAAGTTRRIPIMLQNESSRGFGAVYIGNEPPDVEHEFVLEDADGDIHSVEIRWMRIVAEFVSLLGLELDAA
jgi:hypothetical protein